MHEARFGRDELPLIRELIREPTVSSEAAKSAADEVRMSGSSSLPGDAPAYGEPVRSNIQLSLIIRIAVI